MKIISYMKNSDFNTDINFLKLYVKEFCEERDWDQFHTPKELAIGISTESAELLDLFRFKSEEEVQKIINSTKREEVEDELADILFFLLRFAKTNEIDLSEAIVKKINKNKEKYPIDKVKGNNKKYNEY